MTELAVAIPLVGLLVAAAGVVSKSIQMARVNKMAIYSVGLRIHEVALTLNELLPAAVKANQRSKALDTNIRNLTDILKRAGEVTPCICRVVPS